METMDKFAGDEYEDIRVCSRHGTFIRCFVDKKTGATRMEILPKGEIINFVPMLDISDMVLVKEAA